MQWTGAGKLHWGWHAWRATLRWSNCSWPSPASRPTSARDGLSGLRHALLPLLLPQPQPPLLPLPLLLSRPQPPPLLLPLSWLPLLLLLLRDLGT